MNLKRLGFHPASDACRISLADEPRHTTALDSDDRRIAAIAEGVAKPG